MTIPPETRPFPPEMLARIEKRLKEVEYGEVAVVIAHGRVREIRTTHREKVE